MLISIDSTRQDQIVARYSFFAGDSYYDESRIIFEKYERIKVWYLTLKYLLVATIAAISVLTAWRGAFIIFIFFALLLALLLASRQIGIWQWRRQLRISPYLNVQAQIEIASDRYVGITPSARIELSWDVLSKVRRLPNGLLIYYGGRPYVWLPDAGLIHGDGEGVRRALTSAGVDFLAS